MAIYNKDKISLSTPLSLKMEDSLDASAPGPHIWKYAQATKIKKPFMDSTYLECAVGSSPLLVQVLITDVNVNHI